ncbi:MAG: hypothetical protein MZV70_11755 [Desulfobacterales bacterium]|nr:hypothetical protein [Desulfobacterales bacterium]
MTPKSTLAVTNIKKICESTCGPLLARGDRSLQATRPWRTANRSSRRPPC